LTSSFAATRNKRSVTGCISEYADDDDALAAVEDVEDEGNMFLKSNRGFGVKEMEIELTVLGAIRSTGNENAFADVDDAGEDKILFS
jgi:hypothetical protein